MTSVFHLETDASLNPARIREGLHGIRLVFAGGGIILRDATTLEPVASYFVSLGHVPSAEHAEALALLRGMEVARKSHGATSLVVRMDNLVLFRHLKGEFQARLSSLTEILRTIAEEIGRFESVELRRSPSTHRKVRADGFPTADALARRAAGLVGR